MRIVLLIVLVGLVSCSTDKEKYIIPENTFICRLDNLTSYRVYDTLGDNIIVHREKDFDYLCRSLTKFPVQE